MDYQVLLRTVQTSRKVSWPFRVIIERILQLLVRLSAKVFHVYREINSAADFLASLQGFSCIIFNNAAYLPSQYRAIYN